MTKLQRYEKQRMLKELGQLNVAVMGIKERISEMMRALQTELEGGDSDVESFINPQGQGNETC